VVFEGFAGVVIEGDEAHTVIEIVLGEDAIVDALKSGVKIDCSLKMFLSGFAEETTGHVGDGKLSFFSVVKQVEGAFDILESFFLDLSFQIIN
jgi:hypothetical protein